MKPRRASVSYVGALRAFCAFFLLSTPAGMLRAQSVYSSITDATGAIVSGADATLTNTGTNEQRQSKSDSNGNYQFVNLLPGAYSISIEKTGFRRFTRQPICAVTKQA